MSKTPKPETARKPKTAADDGGTGTATAPRPTGRKPINLEQYQLRLSDVDRAAWEAKAGAAGMNLSQWIRWTCAAACAANARAVSVEFTTSYPVSLAT